PLQEHDAATVAALDPQARQHPRELIGASAKLGEGMLAHPPRVVLVHERHAGTVAGVAGAGVDGARVDGRDGPAEAGVDIRVGLAAGQKRVRHGPVAYHRASDDKDGKLRRVSRRRVALAAVTALFLERQHLRHPRALSLTPGRLGRFVEDVGGLQLDSINVLDRAHYLTVWSRFGPYDRARLDRLVYRRRLLFEYWAHAACLVPASALPWWRRAMLDYRSRHTGWSGWVRRDAQVLRAR